MKDWDEAHDAELDAEAAKEKEDTGVTEEGKPKDEAYFRSLDPRKVSKSLTQRNRNDTIKYMENLEDFDPDEPIKLSEYQSEIVAQLGGPSGGQLEFAEQEEFIEKAE